MTELTLHHGDCLEVMKTIPDKSIDLIICDLPYGCLTGGGGKEKKKRSEESCKKYNRSRSDGIFTDSCAWDVKIDLEPFWKEIRRIRRSDHSPCLHFCTTKFGYDLIKSNESEFRYDLVWDKQRGVSFLRANTMPMRSHEMIYVFSKTGAYYNRVDISGNFRPSQGGGRGSNVYNMKASDKHKDSHSTTTRCALSVIDVSNSAKKGNHPTEKPSGLYKWLIERYCPAGGTVLDPTFGSGNSVFQAFAMGRSAIGIEKDEKFFKKAEERLNALP
jgi:DNA modification methylase